MTELDNIAAEYTHRPSELAATNRWIFVFSPTRERPTQRSRFTFFAPAA